MLKKELASIQFFGESQRCQTTAFPRLCRDTRPDALRRVLCFWGFGLQKNGAELRRLTGKPELFPAIREGLTETSCQNSAALVSKRHRKSARRHPVTGSTKEATVSGQGAYGSNNSGSL
jgi:hypothetical protein